MRARGQEHGKPWQSDRSQSLKELDPLAAKSKARSPGVNHLPSSIFNPEHLRSSLLLCHMQGWQAGHTAPVPLPLQGASLSWGRITAPPYKVLKRQASSHSELPELVKAVYTGHEP